MNIGIIGCGLIGRKRALAATGHTISWLTDMDRGRAEKLAQEIGGARVAADAEDLLSRKELEAVFIATTHNALAPLTLKALAAGKHVLVEKPAAISAAELKRVIEAARRAGRVVKVGFNHRFHPAISKAMQVVQEGVAGPLMFIRGRYGHGGRVGYEKEWRAQPALSGGGEALDQGSHLIDLARWFLGDFVQAVGYAPTFFWDMSVEDNAFMLLRTGSGTCAFLHASWTEWKNMFSMEIYGRTAKLQIDGLGGSYGTEKLTVYKMLPQMGPPLIDVFEFPGEDVSWRLELANFCEAIEGKTALCGDLEDALAVMEVVERVRRGRQTIQC